MGNIYRAEILFVARVHPSVPGTQLRRILQPATVCVQPATVCVQPATECVQPATLCVQPATLLCPACKRTCPGTQLTRAEFDRIWAASVDLMRRGYEVPGASPTAAARTHAAAAWTHAALYRLPDAYKGGLHTCGYSLRTCGYSLHTYG